MATGWLGIEMYHKFTGTILPGRKLRRVVAAFLVFLLLPGVSMVIQAEQAGHLMRQADYYSLKQETPGINQQVRLARGVLLVARKSMTDPNFSNTVLLITEYEETGTVGLVLNRPLDNPAAEILPQLKDLGLASYNLYLGGPVRLSSLRLLVQSDAGLDGHYHVVDNIFQISDLRGVRDLLEQETGQFRVRLYAGYAGWYPGQLEQELLREGWHLFSSDNSLVFTDDPASLWERLIDQIEMQWVSRDKNTTLNASYIKKLYK